MKSTSQKPKFDFAYWFEQLIQAGKQIEPEKYTPGYINKMKIAWQPQPLTKLHAMVIKRKNQMFPHATIK